MTDQIAHLTVALVRDIRDDDVQGVVDAIRQLRLVAEVKLGDPVDIADFIARSRFRNELANKLVNLIISGEPGKAPANSTP